MKKECYSKIYFWEEIGDSKMVKIANIVVMSPISEQSLEESSAFQLWKGKEENLLFVGEDKKYPIGWIVEIEKMPGIPAQILLEETKAVYEGVKQKNVQLFFQWFKKYYSHMYCFSLWGNLE